MMSAKRDLGTIIPLPSSLISLTFPGGLSTFATCEGCRFYHCERRSDGNAVFEGPSGRSLDQVCGAKQR